MELNVAFGEALKRIRNARGKTQEDFSDVSSRTYVSTLERGLKSPTLDKLSEISGVLEIHPLTLVAAAYLIQQPDRTDVTLACLRDELALFGFDVAGMK